MSKELEALINKTSEHLYLYKELKNEPFYKRCQELFQELITIKQSLQPNKEQLRDEIISELCEELYMTKEVLFEDMDFKFEELKITIGSQIEITFDKGKTKMVRNSFDDLASKIIKYFELESE